jgi:hypothetical protein
MPRWNIKSFEGNQECIEMRGVGVNQLCNVDIDQHEGGELNEGRKEKEGVGGKKKYIYSSSLVQHMGHDNFDSYLAFCWLMNTQCPSLHLTPSARHLVNEKPRDKIHYLQ